MSIAEGRKVLDAAGIGHARVSQMRIGPPMMSPMREELWSESSDRYESMKGALLLIKRDLGVEIARGVAERLMPGSTTKLAPLLGETARRLPATRSARRRAGCRTTASGRFR